MGPSYRYRSEGKGRGHLAQGVGVRLRDGGTQLQYRLGEEVLMDSHRGTSPTDPGLASSVLGAQGLVREKYVGMRDGWWSW